MSKGRYEQKLDREYKAWKGSWIVSEEECMRRRQARLMWLERRPPWWRFLAVRRWEKEEPV